MLSQHLNNSQITFICILIVLSCVNNESVSIRSSFACNLNINDKSLVRYNTQSMRLLSFTELRHERDARVRECMVKLGLSIEPQRCIFLNTN